MFPPIAWRASNTGMQLVPLALVVTLGVAAGCHVLPPAPVLPPHAGTATDERGAVTAMIVFGAAGQLLFGGGAWGVALRVERQQTDHTTVGFELTGGRGGEAITPGTAPDGERAARVTTFRHWLVGLRGYGRFAPQRDASVALMSGAGLSLSASGLVTGTISGGVAVAYDSARAIPVGTLGLALAVPLRAGRRYAAVPVKFALGPPLPRMPGAKPVDDTPHFELPRTELYLVGGLGLLVPLGDTGNRLSADFSLGKALRGRSGIYALTLGEAQRF